MITVPSAQGFGVRRKWESWNKLECVMSDISQPLQLDVAMRLSSSINTYHLVYKRTSHRKPPSHVASPLLWLEQMTDWPWCQVLRMAEQLPAWIPKLLHGKVVVVQSLSCVWLCSTPGTAVCQTSLSSTISWSSLKLKSIELVMLSNHLILCLQLFLLPSIFSSIRVFSNESNDNSSWFYEYLLWTMHYSPESSPAQFESSNSLLLSLLYGQTLTSNMITGKTIALTIWTFVSKVMSLLCNTLSRFVIAFCPRNKCLLILWIQSFQWF